MCERHGNRWTIREILSLQREYELLDLSVQQMASLHQRTERAILCKLEAEGFIRSWDDVKGFDSKQYQDICSGAIDEDCSEEEVAYDSDYVDEEIYSDDELSLNDESEVNKLTERVWNLETSVKDIGTMVSKMFSSWVAKKSTKREPLRKY
jgi:hypothetical protein